MINNVFSNDNISDSSTNAIDGRKKLEKMKNYSETTATNIKSQNFNINSNSIIVNYSKSEHKFSLYNSNKTLIGFFNIRQLIKYITNNNNFMKDVDIGTSYNIIEEYIGKNKEQNFVLHSYLESKFLGNIQMLIRLNNELSFYENEQLNVDITNFGDDILEKEKIIEKIKANIIEFIKHTIKIIVTISEEIKNTKKKSKNQLLDYIIILQQRLNTYILSSIKKINIKKDLIENGVNKLSEIHNILINKVEKLDENVNKQTTKLDELIKQINNLSNVDSSEDINSENDFNEIINTATNDKPIGQQLNIENKNNDNLVIASNSMQKKISEINNEKKSESINKTKSNIKTSEFRNQIIE